ncbi:MAG: exodeoxyribonuclease VII small subunit [Gemmatimonadales bacterium]|nr:MAG: exodeoxyribonuclease VII small subunit [Gemmatimonadales bacterium]
MTDAHSDAHDAPPAHQEGGMPSDDLSLEDRLRRLDEIVSRLEGGQVELEAGLALFEEGVRHVREAEALLARAELRVEELVGEAESARTEPMEGGGGGEGS